jgi:hypothetical protein
MIRRSLNAFAAGVVITLTLAVLAARAAERGYEALSHVLFWQNSILQSLVGGPNIGTVDQPRIEGSPINSLAYSASYPLGAVIYGVIAYLVLRKRRKNA